MRLKLFRRAMRKLRKRERDEIRRWAAVITMWLNQPPPKKSAWGMVLEPTSAARVIPKFRVVCGTVERLF